MISKRRDCRRKTCTTALHIVKHQVGLRQRGRRIHCIQACTCGHVHASVQLLMRMRLQAVELQLLWCTWNLELVENWLRLIGACVQQVECQ